MLYTYANIRKQQVDSVDKKNGYFYNIDMICEKY